MRLIARLRAFLRPSDTQVAPLLARLEALEARLLPLEEAQAEAVERELKWAEMNAQLRRYLGRLDAHAGHDRAKDPTNGRGGARADVIAAKFPHGLPPKE